MNTTSGRRVVVATACADLGVVSGDSLSQVLFGPIAKIAAIFGGAIGMIFGLLQHSVTKFLTFGGIMLVSVALPDFIKSFYSILLP